MDKELHKSIRQAIKSGDLKAVKSLLSEDPEAATMETPFGSWLHVAASFGKLDIVRLLVEQYGLDVNRQGGTSHSSPLHRAACDGQFEVVRYLLDKGATCDLTEPERNPLFGAILSGNIDIGKLLIAHGIDTNVRYTGDSMHEMAAIDFARERGANEFITLLGG